MFIALPVPDHQDFYLCGEVPDDAGAPLEIQHVVGPCLKPTEMTTVDAPIRLKLAHPVQIPRLLIDNGAFKTADALSNEITHSAWDEQRRFLAQVDEAQRKLIAADVDLSDSNSAFLGLMTPFGPGQMFAGATVRIRLFEMIDLNRPGIQLKIQVEVAAHARLMVGGFERAVSLAVALRADSLLRVEADDLGFHMPSFKLGNQFKLTPASKLLGLSDQLLDGVATLTAVTGLKLEVLHTNPSAPDDLPKLAIRLNAAGTRIEWAIVKADFNPGAVLDAATSFAQFKVTTTSMAAPGFKVVVEGLQLGDVAGVSIIQATAQAVATPIAIDGATPRRFGPFEIRWEEMKITPAVTSGAGPANVAVSSLIAFQGLTIRVADDPDAFLTFSGTLEVDTAGARMRDLELVQPYPIVLMANVAGALIRGAGSVVPLLLDFTKLAGKQAARLLDILGRMALAAARCAVFIAQQAGEALEALGELLAGGLSAVAEMLGTLLRNLEPLLATASAPGFAIELRVATSPFELRQVLITSRGRPPQPYSQKILGLKLDVPVGWAPGLLIDFVAEPGAYLVLTRASAAAGDLAVATVSTDLWLDRQEGNTTTRTAMRDVDGTQPAPVRDDKQEPLLGLHLKMKNAAADVVVVLAGLVGGKTVFFKRLAGSTTAIALPGNPGVAVRSCDGPFKLQRLDDDFDLEVKFAENRILPLLGMGESGSDTAQAGGPTFLDKLKSSLGNVIWVKDTRTTANLNEGTATVYLDLGLKAAGLETAMTLKGGISLDSLALSLKVSDGFKIRSQRIEENALGLLWIIEQKNDTKRKENESVEMFSLGFSGGQSGFELNTDQARMQLQFNGLSSDGQGIVFEVTTFKIGPGGLDLSARVARNPVRLNGIDVPFQFTDGALEIKGGRLVSATVAGRGSLPPALIGEADCSIALTFGEVEGEGIVLQSGKVELDKKNDPIICHAARFTLTISDLDLSFVKDGGYHFYYLVTGSLRFSPKSGEFESGLLQYLDGVEMNLERTPLSADPRVLLKYISFQKALNPKKSFNLFNLFTFELRGFGYHPASPKFGGDPAVNISGQIKFVEMGDIMQPSIDFHGLWIAPPKSGESLPRIKADGLGIDLNLNGAIRVRGAVIAVDQDTRTVEGRELAPEGYNAYGFLGRGEFDIPGWGSMGASLGFLELERKDQPGERRKSFFFFADKQKLAIEIPAVIWTFYLREAGFGFGFRYTLDAIAAAEHAPSIPKLVNALDDISKVQGDLHKFSAWKPDPEGDKVTLALKGAIQAYPASKTWNEEAERAAQNPFLFDLVAAIRSDFTLFMGLRGWIGTNYIDYLNDKDGLRSRPGLRGYLYISAPQQRLLARMIGDSKGYIGESIPAFASGAPMRAALESIDWSATLFIKPGLFHYELGWPNQLVVRLMDKPNMRVTVRGGMIFRAAEDGLLWAYNLEADAYFHFSGEYQAGAIGVCAEATLTANLIARVLCYLSWRFNGSLVYGLFALDARLDVAFRAWMKIDLGLTSYTLRIGFRVTLQFSAAIEIAISTEGVGARVNARVAVSVFGCTLSVSVGFTIGQGQLDEARARVQRFLAMSITAEQPDAAPASLSQGGDQRLLDDARHAEAPYNAPKPSDIVSAPAAQGLPPGQHYSKYAVQPVGPTNFWCMIHADTTPGKDGYGYALLIPRQPDPGQNPPNAAFYAPGTGFQNNSGKRDETIPAHTLYFSAGAGADHEAALAALKRLERYHGAARGPFQLDAAQAAEISVRWNQQVETEQPNSQLTLALLFDECYLSDTTWHRQDSTLYRRTNHWGEPPPRTFQLAPEALAGTEDERNARRDQFQRNHQAEAAGNPIVDATHQARSTVLAMCVDQFVAMGNGIMPDQSYANVTDLGLLFYGKIEDLEQLAHLTVQKHDGGEPTVSTRGSITIFNPASTWFVRQDPALAADRFQVATEGVRLDWRLSHSLTGSAGVQAEPEHHLHHYEIERTVEGMEFTPRLMRVKAAATLGGVAPDGKVSLLPPAWQFSDDLADLPSEWRKTLLPGKDDAAALERAVMWAERFGDADALTVSYTVTPVDIAGSRGLAKSFLVPISRPDAPVRPAEAELRFVVKRMGSGADSTHHGGDMPQDALAVLIGLKDGAAKAQDKNTRRYYVLYADPENISPSGHYGTDGLTERRLGLPALDQASADSRKWILNFDHFVPVQGTLWMDALEPDRAAQQSYPYWSRLAGKLDLGEIDQKLAQRPPAARHDGGPREFLESLWRLAGNQAGGDANPRIATRFSLQTVLELRVDGQQELITLMSKRVPVGMEIRIEPRAGGEIGLMRPEAFEWPVHLVLPPHADRQIRASTGFARFRAPQASATLAQLVADASGAVALVRDPERRVLTKVTFDAALQLGSSGIDPAHARCVAGYDLHELDLDDLARLDTADKPQFASNALTWSRARRVARIERVSAEAARMAPDTNKDWQGWHAHYPSETWRLQQRANGRDGYDAQWTPRRAGWHSPAESGIAFASRVPRMRLLPTAPEGAVSDLVAGGRPASLSASVGWSGPEGSAQLMANLRATAELLLADLAYGQPAPDARLELTAAPATAIDIQRPDAAPLEPRHVRSALAGLALRLEPALAAQLMAQLANGVKLVCTLTVTANVAGFPAEKSPPALVQEVELAGPVHPVLEELIGELEYGIGGAGTLYRRYVVSVQPVQPVEATSLAAFLADTNADADPYGWAALQKLGLARTLRLYDRDLDRFEPPGALLSRVNHILGRTVARYREWYGSTGQAFAEVLLRPGEDRVSGPFDAVLGTAGKEDELDDSLEIDDAGLSMVQVSLRPAPAAVRVYRRLRMAWQSGEWPTTLKSDVGISNSLIGYEIELTAQGGDSDLLAVHNGQLIKLLQGQPQRLAIAGARKGKVVGDRPAPELHFLLRSLAGGFQPPAIVLKARVRTVQMNSVTDRLVSMTDLQAMSDVAHNFPKDGIVTLDDPTEVLTHEAIDTPFERFSALPSETWAAELMRHDDGLDGAFRSLRMNLRFAAPAVAWPATGDLKAAQIDDYKQIAPAYVPWTERFLAHAAAAAQCDKDISIAFAAPIKANPLQLAADARGQVSLSFLHSDRWAHARVYAVRPTARYQNLALGAGYFENQAEAETLLSGKPLARPIGYALALSPRTEQIEPPVVLGARLVAQPASASSQWELVVARHGEENLAFCNRSLYARLGTEGTALSFVREYRHANWPALLKNRFEHLAEPERYPVRHAELPSDAMTAMPAIDGVDLGALAQLHPSLWKGADIWRIGQLPSHYSVSALAVARAGLVVSRVIATRLDNPPRRALRQQQRGAGGRVSARLLGAPALHISRTGQQPAAIAIRGLRLVSHADVSPWDSREWFTGGIDDIAWWPDPDVRYTLLRQGALAGGGQFLDEDAEVILVANPLDTDAQPVVVRCRGTRFVAAPAAGIRLRTGDGDDGQQDFVLDFDLKLGADLPARKELLISVGDEQSAQAFNSCARHVAEIVQHVRLQIGPHHNVPDTQEPAVKWLRDLADKVERYAAALSPEVGVAFKEIFTGLRQQAAALEQAPDYNLKAFAAAREWEAMLPPVDLSGVLDAADFPFSHQSLGNRLVLRDLPTCKEAAAFRASGHPLAAGGGRLWALFRERLLGTGDKLAIRAVDTRNAIEKSNGAWVAPGEVEQLVGLPDWTNW